MKIKIKRSLKEMEDPTQPPVGAPSDPKRFGYTPPEMSDEDKEALKKKAKSIRDLEPADLGGEQLEMPLGEFPPPIDPPISTAEPYDPDKDPYGPLREVAKRHFPKR